jgi:hypothetical protein
VRRPGKRNDRRTAEFVRLKVDVIVTDGNQSTLIAKQATSVIPIVFAVAGDPHGTGLKIKRWASAIQFIFHKFPARHRWSSLATGQHD